MRVGVITNRNLDSPWASTHYYINRALHSQGVKTIHVAGREISHSNKRRISRGGKQGSPSDQPSPYTPEITLAIKRDIEQSSYDVLLALHASTVIPSIRAGCPLVYVTDATAAQLNNYQPYRETLSEQAREWLHECEELATTKSDMILVPSQWAADSVVQDYGIEASRVRTLEWGGNFETSPVLRSHSSTRVPANNDEQVRLLFVGYDWYRKGGDIAIEIVNLLRAAGVNATLTVVGAEVPATDRSPFVKSLGKLNRAKPKESAQLDELFLNADLLLHPARAECYGHVLCEAIGFGMPVVATRTGGIPQCVIDGETGVLLPSGASANEYAVRIMELLADKAWLAEMAENARQDFSHRLTWSRWATSAKQIMQGLLSPTVTTSPQ